MAKLVTDILTLDTNIDFKGRQSLLKENFYLCVSVFLLTSFFHKEASAVLLLFWHCIICVHLCTKTCPNEKDLLISMQLATRQMYSFPNTAVTASLR